MKKKILKTLTLLILLGCLSESNYIYSQNIQEKILPVTFSTDTLSTKEYKDIYFLLSELKMRRQITIIDSSKINKLQSIVYLRDAQINSYIEKENNYNKIIEALKSNKPDWYDKFWIGATTTAILSLLLLIITK